MSRRSRIIQIVVFILLLLVVVAGVQLYMVQSFFKELGPCGLRSGPYHGYRVAMDPLSAKPTHSFQVEGGVLHLIACTGTADTVPVCRPLIWRNDEAGRVEWMIALDSVRSEIGLTIEEPRLNKERHTIDFFNGEFMEPASFYFDDEWNFSHLCQSPM